MNTHKNLNIEYKNSVKHEDAIPAIQDGEVGLSHAKPFRICTLHLGVKGTGKRCVWLGGPAREDLIHREFIHGSGAQALSVSQHSHIFYEIALIRAGSGIHVTAAGESRIKRGDVLFISPGARHGYRGLRAMVKTNIYVKPEWLLDDLSVLWGEQGIFRYLLADALFDQRMGGGILKLRSTAIETRDWENEIEEMESEAVGPAPSLLLYNACFLKLLSQINPAFYRIGQGERFSIAPDLWAAVETIESLVSRGQSFHPNRIGNIMTAFEQQTGWTPRAYFLHRRICHGMRHLMNPKASIHDIASRLGYADAAHFSRAFKHSMGIPPRAYRLLRLKQQEADKCHIDIMGT